MVALPYLYSCIGHDASVYYINVTMANAVPAA